MMKTCERIIVSGLVILIGYQLLFITRSGRALLRAAGL